VDFATLKTRFPGVYAVGDVATAGVPKAGVFAEGASRIIAQTLIAELRGGERPGPTSGAARATSSSVKAASGAWTSTSCRVPRELRSSTRRPPPWSPRRRASDPADGRAGSARSRKTPPFQIAAAPTTLMLPLVRTLAAQLAADHMVPSIARMNQQCSGHIGGLSTRKTGISPSRHPPDSYFARQIRKRSA